MYPELIRLMGDRFGFRIGPVASILWLATGCGTSTQSARPVTQDSAVPSEAAAAPTEGGRDGSRLGSDVW
jgi:hypothetical protein